MNNDLFKGRGAWIIPKNSYSSTDQVTEFIEGIDELALSSKPTTTYIPTLVKQAISKKYSPDLPLYYSVNPYQGYKHGCQKAIISQIFHMAEKKHLAGRVTPEYDFSDFRSRGQFNLFDKDG